MTLVVFLIEALCRMVHRWKIMGSDQLYGDQISGDILQVVLQLQHKLIKSSAESLKVKREDNKLS